MNAESERVLELLEEINETQLKILSKIMQPNGLFNTELERLNSLLYDHQKELPINVLIKFERSYKSLGSGPRGAAVVEAVVIYSRLKQIIPRSTTSSNMYSYILLLLYYLINQSTCLLCQQCGGERYGDGLRLLRSMCCTATVVECSAGLVCLRAIIVSPKKNFILSGCHFPEDGLIGCDTHMLPHNATIHRCVCLDQSCQSYFPTGNCPQPLKVRARLSTNKKLVSNNATTLSTQTSVVSISSTVNVNEFHHHRQREHFEHSRSGAFRQLLLIPNYELFERIKIVAIHSGAPQFIADVV
ncbi:hypothetical protein DICVIV_02712 [Dictyocaulus viviparus]|uniref:Uncharacterized protein n=1 Tax=Dictyocaulus viviparus TaxID=29172 RepID=A0A0D8Y4N1_DICVI|nr:hypothetical protein DICVIV_02712 [Dictyocaulus viviparus]